MVKYHVEKTMSKPTELVKQTAHKPIVKIDYTITYVLRELSDMLDELRTQTDIKTKTQLFRDRPYSNKKFSEWSRKFEASKQVQEKLKKIEEILESRLVEQGLSGKSVAMTIFLLKNYYNYTDQYQQTVDTSISFKINRGTKHIEAAQQASIIDVPSLPNKNKTITSHNNK